MKKFLTYLSIISPFTRGRHRGGLILYCSLLITSLIIISCSGSKNDPLNDIPIREIKQKVNSNSKRIESLEAYGTISFDSPEQSGSGSIEVKLKKPDSVLISIDGPFGISVVKALITRKDFIYYNVQDNKVILGPSSEINIGAILRLKVSFDDLLNSFSGSFSFDNTYDDSINAKQQESAYLIEIINDAQKKIYFIEPVNYAVNKYNVIDSKETKLLEVNYSKYTKDNDINFPNEIFISKPDKNQTVYLTYEQTELNKKDISFKIKYPKSAKVVTWK